MQVLEFAKGTSYALALSSAPDTPEAFVQDLDVGRAALTEWRAKRGDQAALVMLTVIISPQHHDSIQDRIERAFEEDAVLSPLLKALSFQVALLDQEGQPAKELKLGKPLPAAPRSGKPWWKFW